MEMLALLFGTPAKVKLIKLFVFNPEWQLTRDEIATRAKVSQSEARRTLSVLLKLDLIKMKKKTVNTYMLNQEFVYLSTLREFLLAIASVDDKEIITRLSRAGRLKFVVTAGVFLHDWDGRVDLLVVGDNLRPTVAENAIRSIEADMGRELKYAIFETEDFKYRYGLYDKFLRDMLDFNHNVVLNKIGTAEAVKLAE